MQKKEEQLFLAFTRFFFGRKLTIERRFWRTWRKIFYKLNRTPVS